MALRLLDLVLARDQQHGQFEIRGWLRLAHLRNRALAVLTKSRRNAQMTASLNALREPRGRPGGLPEPVPPNVMVGVPR